MYRWIRLELVNDIRHMFRVSYESVYRWFSQKLWDFVFVTVLHWQKVSCLGAEKDNICHTRSSSILQWTASVRLRESFEDSWNFLINIICIVFLCHQWGSFDVSGHWRSNCQSRANLFVTLDICSSCIYLKFHMYSLKLTQLLQW